MRAARPDVPVGTATRWLLILAGALLLGYLVVPFLTLAGALPASDRAAFLGEGSLQALGVTLAAASAATAIDALLGIPLGLWLAVTRARWRHAVTAIVLLPLAVPPVVGGLLIVLWLGPNGWLGSLLDRAGLDPLNTLAGTILAQMFVAAPFIVISARAAFGGLDPAVGEAARTLGSGPGRTLLRVLLPAARRGVIAGLALGWVRCMGEFGATAIVAYHPYTLPVLTYVRLTGEGLPTALPAGALLALVGAVVAALLLWLDTQGRNRLARSVGMPLARAVPRLAWIPHAAPAVSTFDVRLVLRVDSFDLDVAFAGSSPAIVVLGPSGAGKSLTLRCIAGLLRPQFGRVTLLDRILIDTVAGVDVQPEHRALGYIGQRDGLFEHLDVERNISFALDRLPPAARRARVDELLALMTLTGVRHARPATLSGGERQRTALARALARGPVALLLDEPFSSVDAPLRRSLRELLRGVHERTGLPFILVTHDRDDALDLGDYLVVLEEGRVVQQGPIERVLRRPATRSIANLLGVPNILRVRSLAPSAHGLVRAFTDWGDLEVDAPETGASAWELAVPLHALRIARTGTPCTVTSVRPSAAGWRVGLRAAGGEVLETLASRPGFDGRPIIGGTVHVTIDGAECQLLGGGAGRDDARRLS